MALQDEVESWTRFDERSTLAGPVGRPAVEKTGGGSGLLRLKPDLPPEIAETIDSFERYSFRRWGGPGPDIPHRILPDAGSGEVGPPGPGNVWAFVSRRR